MTQEQKQFIENNIDLIEQEDWKKFFSACPPGTGYYLYSSGIDFLSDVEELRREMFANSEIDTIVVPENIEWIIEGAFNHCSELKQITFCSPVKLHDSFKGCSKLDTIVIPNISVWLNMGGSYGAFLNLLERVPNLICDNVILKDVIIPEGTPHIIGCCFSGYKGIESVIIPQSVQRVYSSAFAGCVNLKNITILNPNITLEGASFWEMGEGVFINFAGTKEQWKNACGKDSFYLTYYTVQCTDGKLTKRKR